MELEQLDLKINAQNGDTGAFKDLAFSITGNVEDAKDITQDTFLRAFKYIAFGLRKKKKILRNILGVKNEKNCRLCSNFFIFVSIL